MKKITKVAAIFIVLALASCGTAPTKTRIEATPDVKKTESLENAKTSAGTRSEAPKYSPPKSASVEEKFALFVSEIEKAEEKGDYVGLADRWEEFIGTGYESEAHLLRCSLLEPSDPAEAEACYREHISRYGERALPLGRLLALRLEKGDIRASAALVEKIEKKLESVDNPGIFLQLSSFYLMARKPEKARKFLEKAGSSGAEVRTRILLEAQLAMLEGDREKARNILEEAKGETRNSPEYLLLVSYLDGRVPTVPPERLPPYLRPYLTHVKAAALLEKEKLDEAEKVLSGWLQKNPNDGTARVMLGNVYFQKGLFKLAYQEYDSASKSNPDLVEAYLNLGIVSEIYLGFPDVAKEAYRKYIELGGNRSEEVRKWLRALELSSGMGK